MQTLIKFLYTLLIAGSVVTFVGLGIFAFYPEKDYETSCYDQNTSYSDGLRSSSQRNRSETAYETCQEKRDAEENRHAENTALIGLFLTVLIIAGIFFIPPRFGIIADGIALGAIFTVIYDIGFSVGAENRVLIFLSGALFLVTSILVTHRKFSLPLTKK